MYSSRKHPYPTYGLGGGGGGGSQEPNLTSKGRYEAKLEFLKGWGIQTKSP